MEKSKELKKYKVDIYCDECGEVMEFYDFVKSNRRMRPAKVRELRLHEFEDYVKIYYENDNIYKCPICGNEEITKKHYPYIIEK